MLAPYWTPTVPYKPEQKQRILTEHLSSIVEVFTVPL